MNEKSYNIVLAVSKNCQEPFSILLKSIYINNKDMAFDINIMYFDLSKNEIESYKKIVNSIGYRCRFIKGPELHLGENYYKHVTAETFLRLFIPALLPKSVKRALYLDIDIVVNGSLKKLFIYPFGKSSVIASEVAKEQKYWLVLKRKNHIPRKANYFNAGMLMMNLEKLRKNVHFNKYFVIDFLENHLNEIEEDDQGYLNKFLWDKVRIINVNKYNYNAAMFFLQKGNIYQRICWLKNMRKRERAAQKHSVIIHYRGSKKPWTDSYNGQLASLYKKYSRAAGYRHSTIFYIKQGFARTKHILCLIFKGK